TLLDELGFEFSPKEYTLFFGQKNKLSVAVYEKGPKVLVQGRGVEEFVQFELEPKILGEAKRGYEEVHSPKMFEAHFGVDESGIGYCGGSGIDSGARRLHQLAGAPREGAWIATRSRSVRERQRDREKAGGNERSTGVARSGKSAFPNCARDRSECISGAAAT